MIEFFVCGTPKTQPRPVPSVSLPSMSQLMRAPKNARLLWHWLKDNCHATNRRGADEKHPVHAWKKIIHTDCVLTMRDMGLGIIDHAIHVDLAFGMPRPKTKTRKTKIDHRYWHAQTPDIDNMTKAVLDALNKTLWTDDALIVGGRRAAFVCGDGDRPGVAIRVTDATTVPIETWADDMFTAEQEQTTIF